jgi:hypothetical protein
VILDVLSAGINAIDRLASSGAVIEGSGWWRVSDGLRYRLLRELQEQDPTIYSRAVNEAVESLFTGERRLAAMALGDKGLAIQGTVLRLAQSDDSFDELLSVLEDSSKLGRFGDALAAQRLLDFLPETPSRTRQRSFLLGFRLWNSGQRDPAVKELENVVSFHIRDRAHAVSAHLVASYLNSEGYPHDALIFAQDAVDLLQQLQDTRGVVMTLTTLSRIRRDLANRSQGKEAEEQLEEAIRTAEQAAELGREMEARLTAIALGNLALALSRAGKPEEAHSLLPRDTAILDTVGLLARLYASAGRRRKAWQLLEEGEEVARSSGNRLARARLLNIAASVARDQRDFRRALKSARESVRIGEELGNRRHLSHAYHTLALAILAAPADRKSLDEARAHAERARGLLLDLHDFRGHDFVVDTLEQIKQLQASTGGEEAGSTEA